MGHPRVTCAHWLHCPPTFLTALQGPAAQAYSKPSSHPLKGREQALSLPALSGERPPSATPFSKQGGLHPNPLQQVVFQAQAWLGPQGLPVT